MNAKPTPKPDATSVCPLCIKQTPRCYTDAEGRFWCGGGHGYMPGFQAVASKDGLMAYIIPRPKPE